MDISFSIEQKNNLVHWNYFLSFDSDAKKLSRYIEFSSDNFKTYSIELVRLLLSIGSEVDVVAKLLCSKVDPNEKAQNIFDYRNILNPKFPKIRDMKILIPRYGLELIPWDNWKNDKSPDWWSGYNEVKHNRDINFKKANLKNTLNSISGLFCLLLYYYKDEAENGALIPNPNLFSISNEFRGGWDVDQSGILIHYNL
jgi:hypothetical protein